MVAVNTLKISINSVKSILHLAVIPVLAKPPVRTFLV